MKERRGVRRGERVGVGEGARGEGKGEFHNEVDSNS